MKVKNVEEYLAAGRQLHDEGYETDGCSFIGWAISDKYSPACWSHDFARRGLITFDEDGQDENDNTFRTSLRHLGMSKCLSNLMYYFTRTQGWFADKVNLSATGFVGGLVFVGFVFYSLWRSMQ